MKQNKKFTTTFLYIPNETLNIYENYEKSMNTETTQLTQISPNIRFFQKKAQCRTLMIGLYQYPRCILAKCSMARKVVYLPVFHLWN